MLSRDERHGGREPSKLWKRVSTRLAPHVECQYNGKKGNEVLPQDITHLIQKTMLTTRNPCQDPADNWTSRRPPDHRKETQTAVVRTISSGVSKTIFPFIRCVQNHLARHSERRKKTRQTEEDMGRQHQGMDRPEFAKSQRAVESREKWRKLVVKSCVGL